MDFKRKFRLTFEHLFTQFGRRASLEDLEQESCQLAPVTHHRIVKLQNDDHLQQLLQKKSILETNRSVIAEDDEPQN